MSVNKLADFSTEELQEEIKRRALITPKMKEKIDWSSVLSLVEYTVYQLKNGYSLPEDFEQDLMEEVLEAVYGKGFFPWWNNKVKDR